MRIHHVVGLVRPENLAATVEHMRQLFGAHFYPIVERPQFGMKMAISLEAGIELIAPLAAVAGHPLVESLNEQGERWISVVMATDNLDDTCARLEQFGAAAPVRQCLMDMPQPYADHIARFDQVTIDPSIVSGLPMLAAQITHRA